MSNPKSQPCRTCKHFKAENRYCTSIQDEVKGHWTGCVRHETKPLDIKRSCPDKATK